MKLDRFLAVAAALVLALALSGAALAGTTPSDNTDVTIVIFAGTEFSVDITSESSNFPSVGFSLGGSGCSEGCPAYYTYSVTDLRGSGAGWEVRASASDFRGGPNNAVISGATLVRTNESIFNPGGFSASADSISTGVFVSTQDFPTPILNTSSLIIAGASGVSGVTPNATGIFSARETMWLTLPDSVAAGTYTSTLTLTLTSGDTP